MKVPFHLRPNKAVDRFLFFETLSRLSRGIDIESRTYIGFGGPFLSDVKHLLAYFPSMRAVSIERKDSVYRRQQRHRPARLVECRKESLESYVLNALPDVRQCVAWLDFCGVSADDVGDICRFVAACPVGTLLRITFRVGIPTQYGESREQSWSRIREQLPGCLPMISSATPADRDAEYKVIREAYKNAIDAALLARDPSISFVPLQASQYADTVQMYSILGIIGDSSASSEAVGMLRGWEFYSNSWDDVHPVQMPILSSQERLFLAQRLPQPSGTGRGLHRDLGYRVGDSEKESVKLLNCFRKLSAGCPHFGQIDI